MNIMRVFNLEFDSYVKEFNISGYRFFRLDDYDKRLIELQHKVHSIHEFNIPLSTGKHTITAHVEIPEEEESPVFEWENKSSALQDVLLLLSLFTGRDVFVVGSEFNEKDFCITADPRLYPWGGILRASLPFIKCEHKDEDGFRYNVGFSITLDKIYSLVRSENWKKKYENGYFLLLAKNSFKQHYLDASFIQCWTIWEHLFAIHNKKWLSTNEINRLGAYEKISYLMVEYDLMNEIDNISRDRIIQLSKIRNRIVHNGRFPNGDSVKDDTILFIRLTEFIIAKILGLTPSNLFNTIEKLDEYLKK